MSEGLEFMFGPAIPLCSGLSHSMNSPLWLLGLCSKFFVKSFYIEVVSWQMLRWAGCLRQSQSC